jgi:hypothetical protein
MKSHIIWARSAAFCLLAAIGLALFDGTHDQRPTDIANPIVTPSDLSTGVAPNAHIRVKFVSEMDPATITPATIQLFDSRGNIVPCRLSYNRFNATVTLDAVAPMDYGTTYQVQVKPGKTGVEDAAGNRLREFFASQFTTAWSPLAGPGGPLLVIASQANPFSTYYPEILRAEGLNEFAVSDIAAISPSVLSQYQLVILGDIPLTDSQVADISQFVTGGGKLIAMHPTAQLNQLLGITENGSAIADGYFAVDPADSISAGIVHNTIQFHGESRLCELSAARSLATVYRDANTALPSPAVTLREVGSHGGMAGAFLFDVARSVVLLRQGNPAWAGQHRTGNVWGNWTQSADLFYGPASFDPQKNWCDPNNLHIPQADELQRLLANMILSMNLPSAPLPRFNYFPDGAKAVVILTGDDHNSGGTTDRFDHIKAESATTAAPMSATSYIFPGSSNSDQALALRASQGFEIALHFESTNGALFGNPSDPPADWADYSQLNYLYSSESFAFNQAYPSLATPRTCRIHGPVWSDYDSLPRVEFAHGVRLDASYYFSPPQFVQDRPGFFTGSGIPMRFATANGSMIDVYQAPTQITDESGQSEPRTIDTLLDNATGSKEFFGAITVNAHDDNAQNPVADAAIDSARRHAVPILSAEKLLDFEDARGNSYFSDMSWNAPAGRLTLTIHTAAGAADLQAMIPLIDAEGGRVISITAGGNSVAFTTASIKGIGYATFPAQDGPVTVQYESRASLP